MASPWLCNCIPLTWFQGYLRYAEHSFHRLEFEDEATSTEKSPTDVGRVAQVNIYLLQSIQAEGNNHHITCELFSSSPSFFAHFQPSDLWPTIRHNEP